MKQVVNSESLSNGDRPHQERPLVFLDTNVIVGYLQGDPSAAQLFSAEADGRISFAVNPIVLQELILGHDAVRPEFERIMDNLRVLPVSLAKAEALLARVRGLGIHIGHSNDLLVLSSADECDFLVTSDQRLKNLATVGKPVVVTPEEIVTHLLAA